MGNGSEAMLSAIQNSLPFGTRDTAKLASGKVSALLYKGGQSCAKKDRGAFMIMLFTLPGVEGVKSDFGTIVFAAVALGTCSGESSSVAGRFFDGLLQDAKDLVKTTLRQID